MLPSQNRCKPYVWCPRPESNRYALFTVATDFKSVVSTNFTTRAVWGLKSTDKFYHDNKCFSACSTQNDTSKLFSANAPAPSLATIPSFPRKQGKAWRQQQVAENSSEASNNMHRLRDAIIGSADDTYTTQPLMFAHRICCMVHRGYLERKYFEKWGI